MKWSEVSCCSCFCLCFTSYWSSWTRELTVFGSGQSKWLIGHSVCEYNFLISCSDFVVLCLQTQIVPTHTQLYYNSSTPAQNLASGVRYDVACTHFHCLNTYLWQTSAGSAHLWNICSLTSALDLGLLWNKQTNKKVSIKSIHAPLEVLTFVFFTTFNHGWFSLAFSTKMYIKILSFQSENRSLQSIDWINIYPR